MNLRHVRSLSRAGPRSGRERDPPYACRRRHRSYDGARPSRMCLRDRRASALAAEAASVPLATVSPVPQLRQPTMPPCPLQQQTAANSTRPSRRCGNGGATTVCRYAHAKVLCRMRSPQRRSHIRVQAVAPSRCSSGKARLLKLRRQLQRLKDADCKATGQPWTG